MQPEGTVEAHKTVLVLQNCVGAVKAEPGSCSEQCVTSSDGENQVKDIKVEDDVLVEEVEDPLPVIDQALQAEHEVGFV
jgi:hypothetical protein